MSKNFEVLRQAGKDTDIFQTGAQIRPGSNVVAGTPQGEVVPSEPRLNGGARVRGEILRLIQRTFLSGAPGAPRSVVFTAVDHGSGCSWVCARAAEALAAHVDGTVCVIETSLHAPSLHRYFGIGRGSGLADALVQQGPVHDFARSIRGTNLWLMSGREFPSDLAGVVSSKNVESRFAEIRAEFSYLLVDAPPVHECAQSMMFCRMADGVVLILEAHATRREAARRVKETLEASNIKLLGAVLNKRTFPIPGALYNRI